MYFSERLDVDIIKYMVDNNFYEDFSQGVKQIIRDGIKYRNGGTLNETMDKDVFQNKLPVPKSRVGDVETEKRHIDFSDIGTEKKVIELSALDDRLNAI